MGVYSVRDKGLPMMYYVYVLMSSRDGKPYTGSTSNLRKRFNEHNVGRVVFTRNQCPFVLFIMKNVLMSKMQDFARNI